MVDASGPSILSFEGVTVLDSDPLYDTAIWNAGLRLVPGELALVRLEKEHTRLPLADAATGLAEPEQGIVRFMDETWQDMPPRLAAQRRGTIGRIFEDGGWIAEMPVDENVTLAQRHHSRRPLRDIEDEAAALARTFGLPGLPRGRPAEVRRQDLRRAACVRAFLGNPILLILERPTTGLLPEIMAPLLHSVRTARLRGASVLWTTSDADVWSESAIRPTHRYAMSGSSLVYQR
jgi:phospholipid/cholesterol/gamma-HCH transport system ATP-binding protein